MNDTPQSDKKTPAPIDHVPTVNRRLTFTPLRRATTPISDSTRYFGFCFFDCSRIDPPGPLQKNISRSFVIQDLAKRAGVQVRTN